MNRIDRVSFTPQELTIDWRDGRRSQLAAVWLRDHCQMPQSRDPHSGQRLFNISDFPLDIAITAVAQVGDVLVIDFSADAHRSEFSLDWLLDNCYCLNQQTDDRSEASKTLWCKRDFDAGLPRYDYPSFCATAAVKRAALQAVKDYGFVILDAVPCEGGEVLKVIAEFGFVRETNYGPLFEVRAEIDANNLAFTNLGLGCHLDNPYRDPVPGVQLLHCLQSSAVGGDSILQDGFMAANILREENPEHFTILSQQWVNYRFRDASTDLQSHVPMFEVNDKNEVVKVRYNNRSITTLNLVTGRKNYFLVPRRIRPTSRRGVSKLSDKLLYWA